MDDQQLHSLLGKGGYGRVFRGTWRSLVAAVNVGGRHLICASEGVHVWARENVRGFEYA